MTVTKPTIGQSSGWGQILNDALDSLDAAITAIDTDTVGPADHNLLEWAYDPALAVNNSLPTAGTVNWVRIKVRRARTVTNVVLYVATAGSTLTSGQCFAALYTGDGNLLSDTGNMSTTWNSAGSKTMPLNAPQSVTPGNYILGFVSNGTTQPAFARSAGSAIVNVGLVGGAAARFGTANTGVTTAMPAALSPMGPVGVGWWGALS